MGNERLLQGDCFEEMKNLESESVDLIIADPPYYKAINEKWDRQWKTEEEYINWCKLWFEECLRVLKKTGSFYCYGNFNILTKLKVLIFDKHLTFRQNITLDKGIKSIAGRTSDKLRMFPTASEYLLFYVKEGYFKKELKDKKEQKNISNIQIAEYGHFYGKVNHGGLVTNWVKGLMLPSKEQFKKLKEVLDLDINFQEVAHTFNLPTGVTDVWNFNIDKERFHPTQKPRDICERIVGASSNEGDVVLIPFMGCGSEAIICKENNRNFIGIELDEKYFNIAKQRLGDALE